MEHTTSGWLRDVEHYYSTKLRTYGATPAGVDWNSAQSQELRFQKILTVCDRSHPFSIIDYGCGYGALVDHLERAGSAFEYWGLDVSQEMTAAALEHHPGRKNCHFVNVAEALPTCDYVVASGTFNVKLGTEMAEWHGYVLATLRAMFELSAKGLAFNVLTSYVDPDRRRPDLYYADPAVLFRFCKTELSRFVTLLHDYELFEFTMLVRR